MSLFLDQAEELVSLFLLKKQLNQLSRSCGVISRSAIVSRHSRQILDLLLERTLTFLMSIPQNLEVRVDVVIPLAAVKGL
jgi:hypothetical protein